MALSGKLIADFASFSAAVQKAEVELRAMETGAGKVGSSLNRMVDQFSGRKLIQDATLSAEAVERIGGTSKLTAAELQRVAGQASAAAEKMRAMGADVPPGIAKIAEAGKQAEGSLSKLGSIASSAFGQFTLAGLASSAIQKVTASVGEFVATATKLPAMESSFKRLAISMGQDSGAMLDQLHRATKGLVADYDLMAGANKAMLLGLPVTSQSMAELAKTATVLGKAMGQDATKSLDDLITALGRSSPMILDNLGLSVKVGEANEAYAATLGKTADALTDAEKKTAFYNAAMEAAKKKQADLGDQALTLAEQIQKVGISIGDVATRSIADLNSGIGRQIAMFSELIGKMGEYMDARRGLPKAIQEAADGEEKEATELGRVKVSLAESIPFIGPWIANLHRQSEAAENAAANLDSYNAALQRLKKQSEGMTFGAARGIEGGLNLGRLADDFRTVDEAASDFYRDWQQKSKKATEAAAKDLERLEAEHDRAVATIAKATAQGAEDWIKFEQSLSKTMDLARADIERGLGGGGTEPLDVKRLVPLINDTNYLEIFGGGKSMTERSAQAVKEFAQKWKDHTLTIAAPIMSKGWKDALGAMLGDSAAAFGGGGGFKSGLKAFGTNFAKDFTQTMLSAIPAIGPILGQFAGPVVDGFKKLFGGLFQGNDARKMFQGAFGDLDTFHTKLLTLGDAGEQFWIRMTQRTGKGDTAGASALIEEINTALDRQKTKEEETAAATVKAEEEKQAARQQAVDLAKAQLQKLDDEIKSLQDSIAGEAPEEFMGIVETQTRARIAALEKERAAAAANVKQTEQGLAESMDKVAEAIGKIPTEIEIAIRTKYTGEVMAPGQTAEPAATGGFVGRGKVIPFARGGGVGTDTVPALLTPGEIILNVAQQKNVAREIAPTNRPIQLVTPNGKVLWTWLMDEARAEGMI